MVCDESRTKHTVIMHLRKYQQPRSMWKQQCGQVLMGRSFWVDKKAWSRRGMDKSCEGWPLHQALMDNFPFSLMLQHLAALTLSIASSLALVAVPRQILHQLDWPSLAPSSLCSVGLHRVFLPATVSVLQINRMVDLRSSSRDQEDIKRGMQVVHRRPQMRRREFIGCSEMLRMSLEQTWSLETSG